MSWGVQVAAKAPEIAEKVKAAFKAYRGGAVPGSTEVYDEIEQLAAALAKVVPAERFVVIESSGHVDGSYGGYANFSFKTYNS